MGLHFCSEEEWKLSKVDMGMVGSVAMGLMRPTAIGALVGCGGFVPNRWLDVGGLRKEIYSEEGDMVGIVQCFAVGRARRGRRWSDLRFGGSS